MIKLIIAGVWVCIVSLGAVYVSVYMATAPAEISEDELRRARLELVRGEAITIPMIADGAVQGYFLGRISFMMDKEKIKGLQLPMTELMTDELFTLLVGSRMVNISDTAAFDIATFRETIKNDMNQRLGDSYIEEVLVEQLDYLSKADVRAAQDGSQAAGEPVKIVEGETVDVPQASGQ